MLPGNIYADPTVTRYHKTQLLGVKDGTMCEQTKALAEPITQEMMCSMRSGAATTFTQVPKRATH